MNQITAIHPDVQAVYDAIAAADKNTHVLLGRGDALFQEIPPVKVRTASQFDASEIVIGRGAYWFATIIRPDGESVDSMPVEWWGEHVAPLSRQWWHRVQNDQNAVVRFDDHLVISHGKFVPVRQFELDGEAAFELITIAEWQRRMKVREDQFLVEHPQIEAAAPAWADRVECISLDDEGASIQYSHHFGEVEIARTAEFDLASGVIEWDGESSAPSVYVEQMEGDPDPARMRRLAFELDAAATFLESLR